MKVLLSCTNYNEMKMRKILCLLFLGSVIVFNACNNNDMDKEARKTMRAWVGKTIQFPVGIQSTVLNKDTLWQVPETPYKILLYTDSVGCTSCKLLLVLWRSFIKEVDATMKDRLSFLFYFQPKDKNELNFFSSAITFIILFL